MATRAVVVFRGNDICFLGIIRSLGKAGIPFSTVSFTWPEAKPWYSEASRFFRRDFSISNPFTDADKALKQLLAIGRHLIEVNGEKTLAIPSSDTNLMFLLDNEERLSDYFVTMGSQKLSSFRRDVAHKYQCFELINAGGNDLAPHTQHCSRQEDIDAVVANARYPVVYKPAVKDYGQSFYRKYDGLKAVACEDEETLRRGLEECIAEGFDLIVQEKVFFRGVEEEIPFYAYVDGDFNIRMAATGIKELIQPYPFGTANVLRLSWHPEVMEKATRVVKALKWRGILMIEFIRDLKDDQLKVIEINVRPWLFIGFYERFGNNYLEMLYKDVTGHLPSGHDFVTPSAENLALPPYHVELIGAFDNFGETARNKIFTDIRSLRLWLESFGHGLTSTYYDHDDPEPAKWYLSDLAERTGLPFGELLALHESQLFRDTTR